ncbi:UDP-glycosyltransferase 74G1 isoform X2 [Arachis hypogaea]|uniref:UDP-glycosyltransferase 74G1 isoform X2 n=1 Tax=Arachis hypogaea TaxID=3818 RepID=UPI003B2284B9
MEVNGNLVMEKKTIASRAHCLVLAYPAQGHINPMIQFSKLLVHEGMKVTLCTTRSFIKKLQNLPPSMSLESISDGFDNGGIQVAESVKAYLDKFSQVGPQTLIELLQNLAQIGYPVDCIIYDALMTWVLDVAKKVGIIGASYLTQNMSVNSIYYHFQLGKIKVPISDEDEILLPSMPKLQKWDLPSFFFNDPTMLKFLVDQFSNIDKADWVLYNSIYELDKEIAEWTTKIWPKFRSVGPNIPSMILDNRIKDDQDYEVAQFKREDCIEWLDNKPKGSVIYVSFGSIVPLNEEQMGEIAYALRDSNHYFLWVVRASEENKLPKDFEKISEKGLIITWCSQLKVLQHEAIACFVTHCGWNSTLETLSLGVPTIAMPQWSDQATNAKYIVDVWKVGIRAPFDDDKKKIVRREALKKCIMEMVDGEQGKEIKKNATQLKKLILEAASVGGSSHGNILEFVNSLQGTTCG